MVLRALTTGSLMLASFLAGIARTQGGPTILRFDQALAATTAEPDATIRSRERVEILYRAGDLPGALREASEGLRGSPADRLLLRRALELETALRMPDAAAAHAAELERSIQRDPLDAEERRWWEHEVETLSMQARELQERQAGLVRATARARWVSIGVILTVLAANLVLANSHRRGHPPG